jgi:hypothetical protein
MNYAIGGTLAYNIFIQEAAFNSDTRTSEWEIGKE